MSQVQKQKVIKPCLFSTKIKIGHLPLTPSGSGKSIFAYILSDFLPLLLQCSFNNGNTGPDTTLPAEPSWAESEYLSSVVESSKQRGFKTIADKVSTVG